MARMARSTATGAAPPHIPRWKWRRRATKRSVWSVATAPFKGAHFATYPPKLIEPCILAGCPPGGTVLDPFFGAGTTGLVSQHLGRDCIGLELSPDYAALAAARLGLTLDKDRNDAVHPPRPGAASAAGHCAARQLGRLDLALGVLTPA
jgi:DNA modification methylase